MKTNKTIGVSLYFFTNDLPKDVGEPACWSKGNLQVRHNASKKIKNTSKSMMFNSVEEIPQVLKKALRKENITLVG